MLLLKIKLQVQYNYSGCKIQQPCAPGNKSHVQFLETSKLLFILLVSHAKYALVFKPAKPEPHLDLL